jgi:hypothetical protein
MCEGAGSPGSLTLCVMRLRACRPEGIDRPQPFRFGGTNRYGNTAMDIRPTQGKIQRASFST